MTSKTVTLEDALALRTAAEQALRALLPVRDAHTIGSPEYNALNRIINGAVDLADQAANAYVDAHIIPAPENPAPGFTAKLAEVAADLADASHLRFDELAGVPVILTGRIYIATNGGTWYEIDTQDELNGNDWVSADVDPDPRGFSSKYDHVSHDVRGAIL
jgi:hypothetical protein